MAAPLAPLAWTALRIGAVAAAAYYVQRQTRVQPKHAWREAALDETPEGVELSSDRAAGEVNGHAAGRFTRTIRLSTGGPGVEVDVAALGRIRFRRVD